MNICGEYRPRAQVAATRRRARLFKVIKGYRSEKSMNVIDFYLILGFLASAQSRQSVRPKPSKRPPKAVKASAQSRQSVRPKPSLFFGRWQTDKITRKGWFVAALCLWCFRGTLENSAGLARCVVDDRLDGIAC